MVEDNKSKFSIPEAIAEPDGVKQSPLAPKWWGPKETPSSQQGVDPVATVESAVSKTVEEVVAVVSVSEPPKPEVLAIDTSPEKTVAEIIAMVPASPPLAEKLLEEVIAVKVSPAVAEKPVAIAERPVVETVSTVSTPTPSPEKSAITGSDEGQVLKTMTDVASRAIERSKSSLARLEQLGFAKRSEGGTSTERTSSTPPKDPFVTSAEKEARLKAIREATAKRIEKGKVPHEQPASFSSAPAPVEAKKTEEVVEVIPPAAAPSVVQPPVEAVATVTTVQEASPASPEAPVISELSPVATFSEVSVSVQAEVVPQSLETLVPPPPRPAATFPQKKPEVRSANKARINEAYLRQLKGEEPIEEPLLEKGPESTATAQTSTNDGRREIPLEPLCTGVFNALGDLVGGVVYVTRAVGGSLEKVFSTGSDAAPKESGTGQVALGAKEVVAGAKEIIKGTGDIVVGTFSVLTVPVVAAIRSMQSKEKSESEKA
ncbi:hypothetical protein CCP3SC1AL1_230007 [Gammaproteobacteria bacterium]